MPDQIGMGRGVTELTLFFFRFDIKVFLNRGHFYTSHVSFVGKLESHLIDFVIFLLSIRGLTA